MGEEVRSHFGTSLGRELTWANIRAQVPCGAAMASIEGDWVDGAVASRPTTTSGCRIVWQVWIEDRHTCGVWADYEEPDNKVIDVAFMTKAKRPVTLGKEDKYWTIDFHRMVQVNDQTGTQRCIRRTVIVAEPITAG